MTRLTNRFHVTLATLALCSISPVTLAADTTAAEHKAKTLCASCHGPEGKSTNPLWPHIAGQNEAYLAKAMKDYQSAARTDALMSPIAQTLTVEDIEELARYYAAME